MTAVVTGASGFIGRHLAAALHARGVRVIHLARRDPGSGAHWIPFDLARPEQLDGRHLRDVIGRPGECVLYHVAAAIDRSPQADAAALMAANAIGSHHLLAVCAELGVRRQVYASSVAVYGLPTTVPVGEDHRLRPIDAYGYSKLSVELSGKLLAATQQASFASLRIAAPYGSGMSPSAIMALFVDRALRGSPFGWFGSGNRAQDMIHVDDIVAALIAAGEAGGSGVFNIGSGSSVSSRELAELVQKLTPGTSSRVGAIERPDPEEDVRWQLDICRARDVLGWSPKVQLADGLARLIAERRAI